MKKYFVVLALCASTALLAAEDGAAIYKTKCAMCHGPAGEGKSAPSLKGTKVDVDALLTKGDASKKAPHSKAISSLTADQAKAVATFVKGLK